MSKILITGVPGTGKTTIGEIYKTEYNYEHIDVELIDYTTTFPEPIQLINFLDNGNANCVITWGFVPSPIGTDIIIQLKNRGFKLIWLDGDRNIALKYFTNRQLELRNYHQEEVQNDINKFHNQLFGIDSFQVVAKIQPVVINPFNEQQIFKNPVEIIKEIENSFDKTS